MWPQVNWHPADVKPEDSETWAYTLRDRHFWPPPDLMPKHPGLIVDLGCNAGFSTGLLADAWPSALVLGVEMNPDTAQRARDNLVELSDRVHIVGAAVGYPPREARAVFNKGSSAVDHLIDYPHNTGGRNEPTTIRTIDDILNDVMLGGKIIDFLKMDVEGAEIECLQDGGDWPRRTMLMSVEVHILQHSFGEIHGLLRELGFKTWEERRHTEMIFAEKETVIF